jgi:hypothetical protein
MGGQACVFYGAAQFSKDIACEKLSTRRFAPNKPKTAPIGLR